MCKADACSVVGVAKVTGCRHQVASLENKTKIGFFSEKILVVGGSELRNNRETASMVSTVFYNIEFANIVFLFK